jgi:hypothetical protein
MNQERLWYVDGNTFAEQIQQIRQPLGFLRDETIDTWHLSYFRFVTSYLSDFESLIAFAAMVVYTTPAPQLPVVQWARTVAIVELPPERRQNSMAAARRDCIEGDIPVPVWLAFDSPVLDALEIQERDQRLTSGGGPTYLNIYRTAQYYYCLEVHHES